MTLEEKYQELLKTPSDVNENFETIRKYVSPGDNVLELGVRECVSTYALLANKPSALMSVDIVRPPEHKLREVEQLATEAGVGFRFVQQDSVYLNKPGIDVLFIDTLHLYSHVVKELWRHAENTNKYIIFHDSFIIEVRACIQDFLFNLNWRVAEEDEHGNGLIVLKRIGRRLN